MPAAGSGRAGRRALMLWLALAIPVFVTGFAPPGLPQSRRRAVSAAASCSARCSAGSGAHVHRVLDLPILGNAAPLLWHGDLAQLLRSRTPCAPVSRIRFRDMEVFLLSDPGLVRQVCVQKATLFANRDTCPADGLTLAHDDTWSMYRDVLNPAFLSAEPLRRHSDLAEARADEMVDGWLAGGAPERVVDLAAECTALARAVLFEILFGARAPLPPPAAVAPPPPPPLRWLDSAAALLALLAAQMRVLARREASFFDFIKAFTNRAGQASPAPPPPSLPY
jgi:cytochrome P450